MTSETIVEKAPGKLMIAGEYSVLAPGSAAIVCAVNRHITVQLHEQDHESTIIAPNVYTHDVCFTNSADGNMRFSDGADTGFREAEQPDYLISAITIFERVRTEVAELPEKQYRIEISSELEEEGKKIGLGSSAAVTIAILRALARLYQLELSRREIFKIALLASLRVHPYMSGADLAASLFGGYLLYRSPDVPTLAAEVEEYWAPNTSRNIFMLLNSRAWEPMSFESIEISPQFDLLVGWSKVTASTQKVTNTLCGESSSLYEDEEFQEFVSFSKHFVFSLAESLSAARTKAVKLGLNELRSLLQNFTEDFGLPAEVAAARKACDAVKDIVGVKPSGSGGGDCIIAFASDSGQRERVFDAWRKNGIVPLDIRVHSRADTGGAAATQSVLKTVSVPGREAKETNTVSVSLPQQRKNDHITLALQQWATDNGATRDLDCLSFVHHALAGTARTNVDTSTSFLGAHLAAPIYINAMTGGTQRAGRINKTLAVAAARCNIPLAIGSASIALQAIRKKHTTATEREIIDSFRAVREHNPSGLVFANLGAGRSLEDALEVVKLLQANALQIHVNAVQETIMPEGDRDFSGWLTNIAHITKNLPVPVIVKEVGFGLSRETLLQLQEIGVHIADVSGTGGTNFAQIESLRREDLYADLNAFGQSTPACLLNAPPFPTLLASGGVRQPLDTVKLLALGAKAVGIAGSVLRVAQHGNAEQTSEYIRWWINRLADIMMLLGAEKLSDLTQTDILIQGNLKEFCELRGIDPSVYARRSRLKEGT